VPQIEVTFDIDANGILKVTAMDKATGRSQHITITASSGLSEAEIERMRKEAEAHAEEDRRRKELIETRNQADNTIYTAEKLLREQGEKISEDLKKQLNEQIVQVRNAMNGDNIADIRSKSDALMQLVQKVGASMYQSGSPAGGDGSSGATGETQPGGDNVVDGEFKNL
ncbi:Hsp70 family protein, partial [Anaerolinea sp.]|uniref:Hsp70 family protein n=1 Tax=Anaerolinea sp. TaxID=1872519 RepID=UPI002ACD3A26